MPCYNARSTLPLALSSLLAQTHTNWECVLVDDGSTDAPKEIVDRASDSRIRYIRLSENQGRGVARQIALDHARGDFLAMLDADDWYYPTKLADQLEVFAQFPKIGLVSNAMGLVDSTQQLIGLRIGLNASRTPAPAPSLRKLRKIPVPHASSLIRMELARNCRYDLRLLQSQDSDFLFQILSRHSYCNLSTPNYMYNWQATSGAAKTRSAYRYKLLMLSKYWRRYPVRWLTESVKTLAKLVIIQTAFTANKSGVLELRRMTVPSQQNQEFHQNALIMVKKVLHMNFISAEEKYPNF